MSCHCVKKSPTPNYANSFHFRQRPIIALPTYVVSFFNCCYSAQVTSDFFHSRLGNQQFNHYPVKFPTQQVCKFLENFYTDYSEYVDDFENLPAKGECPIKPCKIDILNKPFPAKAVPPFFPSGLWKAQIKLTLNDVEISRFELITKARNDLGIWSIHHPFLQRAKWVMIANVQYVSVNYAHLQFCLSLMQKHLLFLS